MNTKRIIQSSLMLVAVAGMTAAGTGAFFSDTETSAGNVFTAGSIDLLINHTAASYNGYDCATCSLELFSGDGEHTVTAGTNTVLDDFPFPAELVAAPNSNWVTNPPAQWIWASAAVLPGDDGTNGDVTYTFERTFVWNGATGNIDFTLDVGADNEYVVYLNNIQIGSGSSYTSLNTNQFSANLQNGVNTLRFEVTNTENLQFPSANTPSKNPAGLLYNITIERENCSLEDLPDYMAEYQAYCQLWESTDLTNESFFNFSDIKPQDAGTNLISMTVESNESYLCLDVADIDNLENSYLDVEVTAGDLTDDAGEMGEFLQVAGWYADSNGDLSSLLFAPTAVNDLGSIAYADSNVGSPVQPGQTEYVELAWCMGDMTADDTGYTCDGAVPDINQTQTDAFLADLQFFAIQTRNNEEYTCGTPLPGVGNGDDV